MTRILSIAAFLLGMFIIIWMGSSFMSSNFLALSVTLVIASVYLIGFLELYRFQEATHTLDNALTNASDKVKVKVLDDWLALLAPGLRSNVRLRIQGEHIPLPSPMMTPYLVGLLVMLGLLGTFAGMVDTLKGAVSALEGTTELAAIREGLTAPIKGLSLAFGTSVAGVSASAILGFISTISRRQRTIASNHLNSKISSVFQEFSLAHNRDQTYKAMQEQAQTLPLVAEKLTTVAERLEYFSGDISRQLINNQEQFHSELTETYKTLANSVDNSLKQSVNQSNQALGDSLKLTVNELNPIIVNMVKSLKDDTLQNQQAITEGLTQQFQALSNELTNINQKSVDTWQQGLNNHHKSNDKLLNAVVSNLDNNKQQFSDTIDSVLENFSRSSDQWLGKQLEQDQQRLTHWHTAFDKSTEGVQKTLNSISSANQTSTNQMLNEIQGLLNTTEKLVDKRVASEDKWLAQYEARTTDLNAQLINQFKEIKNEQTLRADSASDKLSSLSEEVAMHLQELGRGLEDPMKRLIETASETPRAAAEVISQLRSEISNNIERDNQLLTEREQIFVRLSGVADALHHSSNQHSESLEKLVSGSTETLIEISSRFSNQIDTEASRLTNAADNFSVSAEELASVSEAFGTAVGQFGQSNQEVSDALRSIEKSLQSSTQKSDEQMAYYVAQAREIIDHTMLSQQEVIEQIRSLSSASILTEKR